MFAISVHLLLLRQTVFAAGKGVIVATELEQALEGVRECFSGHFGDAGATVVVEEFLEGPECSLLALTDGRTLFRWQQPRITSALTTT